MKATTKRRDLGMAEEASLSAIIQTLIPFPFSDQNPIENIPGRKHGTTGDTGRLSTFDFPERVDQLRLLQGYLLIVLKRC
ncbi:TPA: hypothetical protein ACJIWP_000008 [Enterobacter cloacae]|uniref:Uncharacterized protein n=1 Tax=Enterobacter cloacae TaxID=550 RepID=A0A427KRR1_ENTCL|nr:hypothetical protein [Enterobacter cloacae]RSB33981.1 hypothetical protein EGK68_00555 [Enterobacter cloacae]HCM9193126.1 hypothetical protein [Enterobacter cloacae subsp. dissolvens]